MTAELFVYSLERDPTIERTLGDALALAEWAASWTEAERRKLSKITTEKWKDSLEHWNYRGGYRQFLAIAMLAVGPFSSVKRINGHFFQFEPAALKVLCDRRPEWLEQWLTLQLANRDLPQISWWLFRELLRAGVVSKPHSDAYISLLAVMEASSGAFGQATPMRRSDYLQQNPEFIDDLWKFFEVETKVLTIYLQEGRNWQGDTHEDWSRTLLMLSDAGRMDRQRLLTATLRALNSDFSSAALTGFARFYERLNPTLDEQVAAQASYRELLTSRTSHVVKLALEELAKLQKNNRLDSEAFLAAAPAVFALKPKGHPQTVLSIASKVAKQQPELTPEAANLAIEALAHESSDVQGLAVKLLESWQGRLHRDHASELRARLDGIAASIRPRVHALIDGLDATGSSAQNEPPSSFSLDDWRTRAAAIPANWRSLAGVDDALAAAENDDLFRGSWFNVNYVPVLTSCTPIVPIETVDELLDAVAHAVERIDSADENERILDGVSRLCDQWPADFEHRAKPLVKRLLAERPDIERGILAFRMTQKLPQLLFRWLDYDLANKPPEPVSRWLGRPIQHEDPRALTKFIERRLREIETRVAQRKPAPLLCAPTHQHGWLDPRVLVERLRHYTNSSLPLADFVQALLRLAPDHRQEALAAAANLAGEGPVIRFALGGPAPTEPIANEEAFSLWLAAARSRQAHGPLEALVPAAGDERAAQLLEPSFVWETTSADLTNRWLDGRAVNVGLKVEPTLPRGESLALRPTLAPREDNLNRWSEFGPEWCQAWMTNLWPANLDGFLVDGIRHLRNRVDAPASSLEPNHLYLQPLLQPDRPWNELTWLALWIALVSKDSGSRGMAIDVLIAGIEDGRAEVQCDVLVKLIQGPWLKLNRLVETGREIARVSPRHAWWWAELLQRVLYHLPTWPSDIHHVLALLLELLTELQLGIREECRPRVESQPVTGKGAKLQQALLALAQAPASTTRQRAHELALEATLQRAERWGNAS